MSCQFILSLCKGRLSSISAYLTAIGAFLIPLFLVGCAPSTLPKVSRPIAKPNYTRPLPAGGRALKLITNPAKLPDFKQAFNANDDSLSGAIKRGLQWFSKRSTKQFFPVQNITHEQLQLSLFAFGQLLEQTRSPQVFEQYIRQQFDVYQSVGWDGQGVVLFTGYYSPIFQASLKKTNVFRYPLYRRPNDLLADPQTGKIIGQQVGTQVLVYPTRKQIETDHLLAGHELIWLKDKLEAYLVHVQGSAKLLLPDGSTFFVGYAGSNGRDYTSIGQQLVRDKRIEADRLSLPAILNYFRKHPFEVNRYLNLNDRYIFFQQYQPGQWPAGSLGFKVTPKRTLATDKSIYPRGSVVLVQTKIPQGDRKWRTFNQFMLDQDTGGAIRAPGRGDLYMGIGEDALRLAGRQYAEGRLYYLVLKPLFLARWRAAFAAEKH